MQTTNLWVGFSKNLCTRGTDWVSLTTVNLGVNEFGALMIPVVFAVGAVAGYALNAADKK